jgi:cytochrome c oxidase subunit II
MTTRNNLRDRKIQAMQHQKRLNQYLFAAISVLVLGFAGFLLFNAYYHPPLPEAKNVIDVSADMGGFDKKEIRVKVGEPVTIRLRSLDNSHHTDGGGKHQWAVDDFKANVVAEPESTATVTFTPTKTGEFTFYCDICCGGRANPSMNGKLIVEG